MCIIKHNNINKLQKHKFHSPSLVFRISTPYIINYLNFTGHLFSLCEVAEPGRCFHKWNSLLVKSTELYRICDLLTWSSELSVPLWVSPEQRPTNLTDPWHYIGVQAVVREVMWSVTNCGWNCPHLSRPSLLLNGYRVFPGGKAAGAWRWPPTPSNADVKERIELYLYSPLGLRGLF
jgi:hypothetical protein